MSLSMVFTLLAASQGVPNVAPGFWEKWQPLFVAMSALAAIIVAIVASFQDRIRLLAYAPKLGANCGPLQPDSTLVPLTDSAGNICGRACFLGIPIQNTGCAPALEVEVFAARLETEKGLDFHAVDGLYPLNLTWRHHQPPLTFLPRILRGPPRECAIGMIPCPNREKKPAEDASLRHDDPQVLQFQLALSSVPNTRCDLLTPGKYRLHLDIGAANARALARVIVEFDFSGKWADDPRQMIQARVL
jgi:hypothetical protein